MAARMAAMQSLLNSMTPEQRAQLQGLSEQLLEDMDLRWQMDQLGGHLQELFPQMGWERRYDFSGQDPLGFADAAAMLNELGDLDQLETIGGASCRERVCQYGSISVVAVSLKKKSVSTYITRKATQ